MPSGLSNWLSLIDIIVALLTTNMGPAGKLETLNPRNYVDIFWLIFVWPAGVDWEHCDHKHVATYADITCSSSNQPGSFPTVRVGHLRTKMNVSLRTKNLILLKTQWNMIISQNTEDWTLLQPEVSALSTVTDCAVNIPRHGELVQENVKKILYYLSPVQVLHQESYFISHFRIM